MTIRYFFASVMKLAMPKNKDFLNRLEFFLITLKLILEEYQLPLKERKILFKVIPYQVIEFYSHFFNGIRDFAINKELKKQGISNKLTKHVFFFDSINTIDVTKRFLERNTNEELRRAQIFEYLSLLPSRLDIYEHGGLSDKEKESMEKDQKNFVGEKWKITLNLLRQIDFYKPKESIELVFNLFHETLGNPAHLTFKINKKYVFRNYKQLPKFWNNDEYQVIHI